jgi:transcriptional regulator with XRE-family HTH domain
MRTKIIHKKEYIVLLECIRAEREKLGITQNQLAILVETDQTAISKIETGERRLDFIELRAVCKALNIELQDFIMGFEARLIKRNKI